jgi:hypothetical protein
MRQQQLQHLRLGGILRGQQKWSPAIGVFFRRILLVIEKGLHQLQLLIEDGKQQWSAAIRQPDIRIRAVFEQNKRDLFVFFAHGIKQRSPAIGSVHIDWGVMAKSRNDSGQITVVGGLAEGTV